MPMREDFCAFILTHGRPDRVHTYNTLMRAGYTGKVFIVIDDEDKTEAEYRKRFGDKVLQFSKEEVSRSFDQGDNFDDRRTITYARNACFDLAVRVGCKSFIELDDDYTNFIIRHDSNLRYHSGIVTRQMDGMLESLLEFFDKTPCLSLAMSQGGDHIGGEAGQHNASLRRKCMNTFICSIDRRFKFRGTFNEDVNTYVTLGRQGQLFFTVIQAQVNQLATQSNEGGITELYKKFGTYVKAMTTVCHSPSCVKVGQMGDPRSPHHRIHHKINWHNCAPKILRETCKK